MSTALLTAPFNGSTHSDDLHFGCSEFCEETGERWFRAGDYAAPGEYEEVETGRRLSLKEPAFLPARHDGQAARYRLVRQNWAANRDGHRWADTSGTSRPSESATLAAQQAQFQRLVEPVHQRLYSYARRSLGNSQDAEDVTQETLARAWNHFDTFDSSRPFEVWVFRIARNLLIDQSRRRSHRREVSLDAPVAFPAGSEKRIERDWHFELSDSSADPERCLMHKEFNEDLQKAMRFLPPIHRATMLLVAQKRSYEQIADAFACPVGTVRSRIYRARVLLRSSLKEKVSR